MKITKEQEEWLRTELDKAKKVSCNNCKYKLLNSFALCTSEKAKQDIGVREGIDWRLIVMLKSDMNNDGYCVYYKREWWRVFE